MKTAFLFLFLTACDNAAVNYAKALYGQQTKCEIIHTEWLGQDPDAAVCNTGRMVVDCRHTSAHNICSKIRDISPEERESRMSAACAEKK